MLDDVDLLVCGAGPVGCVLAERAARVLGWKVLVVDRRSHLAGNCHDAPHTSGVLVHRYGPHYFRTRDESLVRYLSRFTEWIPAKYEVRSLVRGTLYPFPINLTTLETFFGSKLTPESARALLDREREKIDHPRNSEEYVLSRVGRRLYDAFYRDYTLKQWGRPAADLDPEVCGRIPVRLDRDDRYVDHPFQMMPRAGFTAMFRRMLRHRRIRVLLDQDFREIRHLIVPRKATVYAGPIDEYFDHRLGRLPYRSLSFDFRAVAVERVQPCVQINFPDAGPVTRSVEIKHITGQVHPMTVLSLERPGDVGEPYYPVPTSASRALYERYRTLAEHETRANRVYFCGRLAQYRYFNTDEVIQEALGCFRLLQQRFAAGLDRSCSSRHQPS